MTTVIQQPSFWDYLGQGLNRGVDAAFTRVQRDQDFAEREATRQQQEALAMFNALMSGVNSGTVRAGEANRNPLAQQYGINFMPSRAEMARDIVESPMGKPQVIGSMPTPLAPAPMLRFKPWSNEQRVVAGVPTREEMFAKQFEPLQAELTGAADRYVSAVYDPNIQVSDRNVRTVASKVAEQAYNMWYEDQVRIKSPAVNDPGTQQYARRFFDNAVMNRIQRERELKALEVRASNSYGAGGSDEVIKWFNGFRGYVDQLRRENDRLMANYPMAQYPGGEAMYANVPGYQEAVAATQANNQRIAVYEQAMAELGSGRVPGNLRELAAGMPVTTTANPAGGATPGPGGAVGGGKKMTPEQIDTVVRRLQQVPTNLRQEQFQAMWTAMDIPTRQAIARRVGGINP